MLRNKTLLFLVVVIVSACDGGSDALASLTQLSQKFLSKGIVLVGGFL